MNICIFIFCFFWVFLCSVFPSVLWYCWLGLLTCKTVSQITYAVLVETLNTAQSIIQCKLVVVGLPERHKCRLIGIVVQRLTGRNNGRVEPLEPNKPPITEVPQVLADTQQDLSSINYTRLIVSLWVWLIVYNNTCSYFVRIALMLYEDIQAHHSGEQIILGFRELIRSFIHLWHAPLKHRR